MEREREILIPAKGRKLTIKQVIAAQQDPFERALEVKQRLKQGEVVSAEEFLRAVSAEEG